MTNLSPRQLGAMTNTEYDEFCARAAPRDAPSDAPGVAYRAMLAPAWWDRKSLVPEADLWSDVLAHNIIPTAPEPLASASGVKPAIHGICTTAGEKYGLAG